MVWRFCRALDAACGYGAHAPANLPELEATVSRDLQGGLRHWNERIDAGEHPHVMTGTGIVARK